MSGLMQSKLRFDFMLTGSDLTTARVRTSNKDLPLFIGNLLTKLITFEKDGIKLRKKMALIFKPSHFILQWRIFMRSRESRKTRIIRTLNSELGQTCVDYVNGNNGMKRWSNEFKNHVLDSLHLGRVHTSDIRALIRAIKFMSYITFHNEIYANSIVDSIIEERLMDIDTIQALKRELLALWREARDQQISASEQSILTRRFKTGPVDFARRHSLYCTSDSMVKYEVPRGQEPTDPLLYTTQIFRGNWIGRYPTGDRVGQSLMYLEVGRTSLSGATLKLVVNNRRIPAPDRFPVYFLPWSSLRVAKITLPQPRPGASHLFCTSSLGGCSVFVVGNPQTPTIYHLGVDSTLHGKVGSFKNSIPSVDGHSEYSARPPEDDRAVNMMAAYRRHDSREFWWELLKWKEGMAGTRDANNVFEVSAMDYTDTNESDNLIRHIRGATGTEKIIKGGTVFGRWHGGQWNFYLQKNARIYNGRIKGALYFPYQLIQFFPVQKQIMLNTNPPKSKFDIH